MFFVFFVNQNSTRAFKYKYDAIECIKLIKRPDLLEESLCMTQKDNRYPTF